MSHDDYLITLQVPPSLEEAVVDCLLSFENPQGFASFRIDAHHHRAEGLSLAEQVSGRQGRVCFQINLQKAALAPIVTQLKTEFSGAGIGFWITPILEQGQI